MRTLYLLFIRGVQAIGNFLAFTYDLFCSAVFNFVFLPFKQAIYLPIWVENLHFHNTKNCTGKIVIATDKLRPRMIKLGKRVTPYYKRGITLNIAGTLVFSGRCKIGAYSVVEAYDGTTLTFGDNVGTNDCFRIVCSNKITIGDNTSIGWNVSIRDTDFHPLEDVYTGKPLCKPSSPIIIGRNNWIASDCRISKGFRTADDVVVAQGTKCSSRIKMNPQSLIGEKNPCEVLDEGIRKMF